MAPKVEKVFKYNVKNPEIISNSPIYCLNLLLKTQEFKLISVSYLEF